MKRGGLPDLSRRSMIAPNDKLGAGMSWEADLDELRRRQALTQLMGGEERVAKHKSLGKLTVRERIDALLDPGSFHEIGSITGSAEYGPNGEMIGFTPVPFLFGRGLIDGRTVVVHRTAWNRLDVSDASTGALLVDQGGLCGRGVCGADAAQRRTDEPDPRSNRRRSPKHDGAARDHGSMEHRRRRAVGSGRVTAGDEAGAAVMGGGAHPRSRARPR